MRMGGYDRSRTAGGFAAATLALLIPCVTSAAPYWARTIGGNGTDRLHSAVPAQDGGFVLAGYTSSFGGDNAWVVKLDANGDVSWQKYFGGTGSSNEFLVRAAHDGGYYIGGTTSSFGAGSTDAWLLKLDGTGSVQWQRTYGGANADRLESLDLTHDGGVVIAGYTLSFGAAGHHSWALKVAGNGTVEWARRRVYGVDDDIAFGIDAASTGNFGFVWRSSNAGTQDVIFMLLTAAGTMSNRHLLATTGDENPYALDEAKDGGWFVAGEVVTAGTGSDGFCYKLNSTGSPSWQKRVDEAGFQSFRGGVAASDGGFLAVGGTSTQGNGAVDLYLVKFDSTGSISWARVYGGAGDDIGFAASQLSDGGFIVAGTTTSYGAGGVDAFVLRIDSSGNISPSCGTLGLSVAPSTANTAVADSNAFAYQNADTAVTVENNVYNTNNSSAADSLLCESSAATADLAGSWPAVRKVGNRVEATFACRNDGTGNSPAFTVQFYSSKKGRLGRRSTALSSEAVAGLAPGGSVQLNVSSALTRKHKWIIAVIDPGAAVAETSEANNTVAARIR